MQNARSDLDLLPHAFGKILDLFVRRVRHSEPLKQLTSPLLGCRACHSFERRKVQQNVEHLTKSYSFYDAFQSDEVYGWSLWEKLDAYVKVVSVIAKYLKFDVIHCHDWLTYRTGIELKNRFNMMESIVR